MRPRQRPESRSCAPKSVSKSTQAVFTLNLKECTFFGEGCFPNYPRCVRRRLHLPYRGRFLGKTAPALRLGFSAHPHLRSSGLGLSTCLSRPKAGRKHARSQTGAARPAPTPTAAAPKSTAVFSLPKNGGEKGGGKVAGPTFHLSLSTLHFKIADPADAPENIIHHSSFTVTPLLSPERGDTKVPLRHY